MRSVNESPPPLDMASTSKKRKQDKNNKPTLEEDHNMALTHHQNSLEQTSKETTTLEGISMNNNNILHGNINNRVASYPIKNNIDDNLGPYKWLDDEIMKLRNMFENGVGNYVTSMHDDEKDEKGNECDYRKMHVEIMETNMEKKNGVWEASYNGENNKELYNCFSTSANFATDFHQSDWDFCHEDKIKSSLWGTGIGEIMNGFYW